VAGCWENGNETLGSTKSRQFLGQMSDYQLLKKDPAP